MTALRSSHPTALAVLLLAAFAAASCSDKENSVKVMIFSTGSEYSGSYVLNGGTLKDIPASSEHDGIFYDRFTLEDVDQVEIEVATVAEATSLSVKLYRDDKKVKDMSATADSEPVILQLSFTYDIDEDKEDDGDEGNTESE